MQLGLIETLDNVPTFPASLKGSVSYYFDSFVTIFIALTTIRFTSMVSLSKSFLKNVGVDINWRALMMPTKGLHIQSLEPLVK